MVFIRTLENFTCEHCGAAVQGNGYTNHCPQCLWSKHVDVSPGDRAHSCGGLMRPIRIEGSTPDYILIHRCEVCHTERSIKSAPNDSPDVLVELARVRGAKESGLL